MGFELWMDDLVDGLNFNDIEARFDGLPKPSVLTWYSDETLKNTPLLVLFNPMNPNGLYSFVVWQFFDEQVDTLELTAQPEGQPVALTSRYSPTTIVTHWSGVEGDRFRIPAASFRLNRDGVGEKELVLPPTHRLYNSFDSLDSALASLLTYIESFYPVERGWRLGFVSHNLIVRLADQGEFIRLLTGYINGDSKRCDEQGHGDGPASSSGKPPADIQVRGSQGASSSNSSPVTVSYLPDNSVS